MAEATDYYELLGIGRDADQAEIKKAFRRLARQYHPDKTGGDEASTEKFKAIGQAYAVLGDPEKRAHYDRYGRVAEDGGFAAGDVNFDMFGDLGSIFQSIFGGGFGGFGGFGAQPQQRSPGSAQPGQSLVLEAVLTLEDVARGTDHEVKYQRLATCSGCFGTGAAAGSKRERCSACGGHGQVQQTHRTLFGYSTVLSVCPTCRGEGEMVRNPCDKCRGKGRVPETVETSVRLPAGVDDGMRVRVRGGGDRGVNGGPDGDLLVQVRVRPHERFAREGRDVLCEQPISFAQAALGDTLEVPGLTEPQALTVPAGTQTGKTLRIAGAGLADPRDQQLRGDMFVTVRVVTPTHLSAEEKELLYRFAQLRGEHPGKPEEGGLFEKLLSKLTGR
jgi:molecular chaperone DnaJ